jgi:glyoxylase-like metal-dependent hydrolase (beta-lactamase superfamily II)
MESRFHAFQVGSFNGVIVSDGGFPHEQGSTFPFANASEDDIQRAVAGYTGSNELSFNCLFIDTGAHRVLVDTGSGPDQQENAGFLLGSLELAGIAPESIDTVIITHLHGDHVAGATRDDGSRVYPNARYVFGRQEWREWRDKLDPNATDELSVFASRRLLPLEASGHVDLVEPDEEIVPGIRAVAIPGHTAGQMGLLIESDGDRLLCIADAIHHGIQFACPDWYLPFDYSGEQAVATRRRVLSQAARDGARVHAYHLAFPGLGRVREDGDVWQWEPETS